jgi:uncharacterized C2H2 Zn-finger protein
LTCPECGKTFTRAASLGAHRNRAHGVAGATTRARATRRRRSTTVAVNGRRRAANGRRRSSSAAARAGVDRDALLQALFPDGLPARDSVIRAANEWLDQAEQLAKLK